MAVAAFLLDEISYCDAAGAESARPGQVVWMKRRDFLTLLGRVALAAPNMVSAIPSRRIPWAKPADAPFERPVRSPLAVDLKAARKAGLDVPPTLLALADGVIE